MSKEDQTESVEGLYEKDGKLYLVKENGDMFKFDFDTNQNLNKKNEHAIKNNIEMDAMDNEETVREDITKTQVRENYWHETKETKLDGSTAMMEARISKCIEAGGSLEDCRKKVKAEMKKKGSENTNTEDIVEELADVTIDTEDAQESEKTEICPKKLDMLIKKAEEFDKLQAEKAELEETFESFKSDFKEQSEKFDVIFKEREAELESKRQEKIKQISTDFDIPLEEIQEDSIDEIEKLEKRLGMAIKPNKEDVEPTIDFSQNLDKAQEINKAMFDKYRL